MELQRTYEIPKEIVDEAMQYPAPYETCAEMIDLIMLKNRTEGAQPGGEFMERTQQAKWALGNSTFIVQGYLLDESGKPLNLIEIPNLSELGNRYDIRESTRAAGFPTLPLVFSLRKNNPQGEGAILKTQGIDLDSDKPGITNLDNVFAQDEEDDFLEHNTRITTSEIVRTLELIHGSSENDIIREFAEKLIENAKIRVLNKAEAVRAQEKLSVEVVKLREEVASRTKEIEGLSAHLGSQGEALQKKIEEKREEIEGLKKRIEWLEVRARHLKESVSRHNENWKTALADLDQAKDAHGALQEQIQEVQKQLNEEMERAEKAEDQASALRTKLNKRRLGGTAIAIGAAVLGVVIGVAADRLIGGGRGDDPDPGDDDNTPEDVTPISDDDATVEIEEVDEDRTPEPPPITPPKVSPLELSFQNAVRGRFVDKETGKTVSLPDGEIKEIYVLQYVSENYLDGHVPARMFGEPRGFKKGDYMAGWMAYWRPAKNDVVKINFRDGREVVANWRANDVSDYPDDDYKHITPWKNQEIWVVHKGVMQFCVVSDPDGGVPVVFYETIKSFQAYPEGEVEIYTNVKWDHDLPTPTFDSDEVQEFSVDQFLNFSKKRIPND